MALSKKTPFYEQHKKHNAKIVDFGGWLLPVQYTKIQDEHLAVRQRAGLFDASHMGEFLVTGRDAERYVDYILTNAVLNKKPYKAIYSPMLNERGGIVDDLIAYKYNRDKLMIVVNASNIDKDLRWMKSRISSKTAFDVKIQDLSEDTCLLAVQGPASQRIMERLVRHSGELRQLQSFSFYEDNITNVQVIVARTGYTGELGYEIYFNKQHAGKIWNLISEEGRRHGLAYCGLGARDSLRLEKCLLLYGSDISETTTPFEADIRWTVNLKKDFCGKDNLVKAPVQRKLTAFEMLEPRIPRHEYAIFAEDGTTKLGEVTSGGVSFTLKKNIGMGYVPLDYTQPGKLIKIQIRDVMVPAKVVDKPFVR